MSEKNVKLFIGYSCHCSYDCANHDVNTVLRGKRTRLSRYGDENYNNPDKISASYWAKPAEERKRMAEEISRRVFGKSPEEKLKIRKKREDTSLRNYGVAVCCHLEKTRQTCMKNYGTPYFTGSAAHRKLFKDPAFTNSMVSKQIETKRRNKTFKTSYKETLVFSKLSVVFPDLVRQYKSEEYPFLCDFYSPAFDLYIEYNGTWTHGGHEFDARSAADIEKLCRWKGKAKMSKYYENAIQNWTVRDKIKFETARKNSLNYLVFWNMREVEAYVSEFFSKFASDEGK